MRILHKQGKLIPFEKYRLSCAHRLVIKLQQQLTDINIKTNLINKLNFLYTYEFCLVTF